MVLREVCVLIGIMSSRDLNDHRHRRASLLDTESAKLAAYEIDDLLSSTGGGKHDYDWLLTPPGTPDFPPSKGESRPTLAPPRSSLGRSSSNTNVSRLTASQSHNHNQSRLPAARSSSVSRSSMSSSQDKKNYYSSNRSSSSILNARPSSPITRSATAARSSTPSRSSADKTRPSSIPNLHSPSAPARSLSRPCTPTRRHSVSSPSPTTSLSAAISRPSSPGPRLRPPPMPVVPPDFPLETPPNLRTTSPHSHRPVSAGRSRPGAVTLKPNSETQSSRTHSSPLVNRGRLSLSGKGHADGRLPLPHAPEAHTVGWKSTVAADKNGFGRTISKKSLDVAIRHMDVRNSSESVGRSLSSATLFPQSIRKGKGTTQQASRSLTLSSPASVNSDSNGRGRELSEVDRYQYQSLSSRYDAHAHANSRLLLTQDLNNTNWLHSVDDQRPVFDYGFESLPLPEPFALL